jgi:hypothetical protein
MLAIVKPFMRFARLQGLQSIAWKIMVPLDVENNLAEINVGVTQSLSANQLKDQIDLTRTLTAEKKNLAEAHKDVVEALTSPNLNLAVSSHEQANALFAVIEERNYQDGKWGHSFERTNMTKSEWIRIIGEYSRGEGRAKDYPFNVRMIKAAAIAVAAVEWEQRQIAEGNPVL